MQNKEMGGHGNRLGAYLQIVGRGRSDVMAVNAEGPYSYLNQGPPAQASIHPNNCSPEDTAMTAERTPGREGGGTIDR